MTFSVKRMTFTFLKVTFTILKVVFSDEKVVFSVQFSREFNRKVYLLGNACQASIAKDHLFLANGHLSDANYTNGTVLFVYSVVNYTKRTVPFAPFRRTPSASSAIPSASLSTNLHASLPYSCLPFRCAVSESWSSCSIRQTLTYG